MQPKPKPIKQKKQRKHKKKTPRQLMELRLDALVKEIVLLRDGRCVCPTPAKGHTLQRQPGHIISRGKESVKWDLMNVHEQCSGCNARHEYYPELYTGWFIKNFGQTEYISLVERSYKVAKLTMDNLETLEYNLTEVLKSAQNGAKPYHTQRQLLNEKMAT